MEVRGAGRAAFAAILLMIAGTSIGAIGALLSISGAFPFWSLGVFAICLWVLYGLVVYGEPERPSAPTAP